jgi:hypothetical protein
MTFEPQDLYRKITGWLNMSYVHNQCDLLQIIDPVHTCDPYSKIKCHLFCKISFVTVAESSLNGYLLEQA